ncbi:MAG: AAA family ATPase [Gemmatimonadota bacterium]|nr:AAA family ATPase [Gemmatimonadota bacterium]
MITQIEIGGYRLLDEFEADLTQLTVVIGANAVGKSTLIDCLQLIAQCSAVPINTAMGWPGIASSLLTVGSENRRFTWKITFHQPDTWDAFPLEKKQSLVYEVVLQADALGLQMHPQYEVLRTREPLLGYSEPLKFLEVTPYQRHIFDIEQRRLIPFDEAQPPPDVVRESDSAEVTSKSGLPQPTQQEPALLLSQIRFFNEFPIPSRARVLLESMAFYPGFDVTRSSTLRTRAADIKPVTTLSANGDNLGTVLHEILTRYDFRSAAEELRDFLRVAYPAFEEIHCDTTYGTPAQVLVRVREKGMSRSMELWELSDGLLRFLCLATALLDPQPPLLIAIDEPELGLHPGLLPIVAGMIKVAAERTQVLVTTHSPDLLNCFEIANVAVMARDIDDAKVVWHRPANRKTLVQMLKDVSSETLGDLHRSGELEAGV